jgi:hypothetical protein
MLIASVAGLTDAWTPNLMASNLRIEVSDVDRSSVFPETAVQILPGSQPGAFQIQFTLDPSTPYGPDQVLWVGIGTRLSQPYLVPIRPQ